MLHLVVWAVEARQCNKVQVCDATVDAAKNKCRASKKNEYGNSLLQIINSTCSTIFVYKHYYKFIEPQDDHTCTATYNYRQYFWTTVLLQALPGGQRAFEQCRHLLPAGQ